MNLNEVPVEMRPLYNFIFNGLLPLLIVGGIITILVIIAFWKIYKKAGKPGWASIVPIYNTIVLLEITKLPIWYIALMFIPFANIYAMFKIYIELAHKFGKSTGFGVASVFFPIICMPILAFSKNAVYNNGLDSKDNENLYQPQILNPQPVNYGEPDLNNNQMSMTNNMEQNVVTNPVETQSVAPQMPVENIIPVQEPQILNPQPVNYGEPDLNNNQMSMTNNIEQNVVANPVETQSAAPQMPVENIISVQEPQILNPQPVNYGEPDLNNNQMSMTNNMEQNVVANPVETQSVAPQMPVENIIPVQEPQILNPQPVNYGEQDMNNNQNGGMV